jgi:hypothetical protein
MPSSSDWPARLPEKQMMFSQPRFITFGAVVGEPLGDGIVVLEPVQPLGDAARNAADHGARQRRASGRSGCPADFEQLDGAQAELPCRATASASSPTFGIAPLADGVVDVPLGAGNGISGVEALAKGGRRCDSGRGGSEGGATGKTSCQWIGGGSERRTAPSGKLKLRLQADAPDFP